MFCFAFLRCFSVRTPRTRGERHWWCGFALLFCHPFNDCQRITCSNKHVANVGSRSATSSAFFFRPRRGCSSFQDRSYAAGSTNPCNRSTLPLPYSPPLSQANLPKSPVKVANHRCATFSLFLWFGCVSSRRCLELRTQFFHDLRCVGLVGNMKRAERRL